jgi:hypothetical protein
MKLFIVILTITCGSLESSFNYPTDILENPKDDCGNICGKFNTNNTDSKCGDPDKQNMTILLFHDKNEEQSDYNNTRYLECVDKCPDNLQIYNHSISSFCVKDVGQFAKDIGKYKIEVDESTKDDDTTVKQEQQDEELDYTWWIVGGISILLVIFLIVGLILKKLTDNVDFVAARPIQRL